MKYCLPIIKDNFQAIESLLGQVIENYDYFEIWLDYLPSIDPNWYANLCSKYPNKLLFVLRRLKFEECTYNFEDRKTIIKKLTELPCLLDLDLTQHTSELEYLQALGLTVSQKLVLSYHDYNSTPEIEVFNELFIKMQKYRPFVYKFSTFCNSYSDSIRLVQYLSELRKQYDNVIVLGMGEYGKITRILGQLLGNFMLFVCANDSTSAPGQLSKKQIENILKELER